MLHHVKENKHESKVSFQLTAVSQTFKTSLQLLENVLHQLITNYYAFNPQRISAGLALFHCQAVGAVLPPTVHKSFIFWHPHLHKRMKFMLILNHLHTFLLYTKPFS
jgi:hypothetical protein